MASNDNAGWWESAGGQGNGVSVSKLLKDTLSQDQPLTRESLDDCVEKITRRIDDSKARIYETVNKNYSELVHALSFSENALVEIEDLVTDLNLIEQEAKQGKLASIVNSKNEQRILANRLSTTKATTVILQRLCEIDTALRSFDGHIECGSFSEAADAMHKVSKLVSQLQPESENGCDPKIFAAVRADMRRKRSKLKNQLEEMWRRAVVLNPSATNEPSLQISPSVEVPHGRAEVSLPDLLEALTLVSLLDTKLNKLAEGISKTLLKRISKDPNFIVQSEKTQKDNTLRVTKSVAVGKKAKSAKERALQAQNQDLVAITGVYTNVLSTFQFIASAFQCDSSVAITIGSIVWPPVLDSLKELLTNRVSTNKPQFEAVLKATEEFESNLEQTGFISDGSHNLTEFVEKMTVHQTNKRRQELLETARELLSTDVFNTVAVRQETERGGLFSEQDGDEAGPLNESLYRLPACHVSVSTKSLVDFAYNTLSEMSADDPEDATMTFYGVRDVFDLFRALVPLKHADTFSQVPQLCAVFYNDCFYIAHHLLTLGHQFRNALPAAARPAATFVDMVPAFQELGERHFLKMRLLQQTLIKNAISEARGFSGTDDEERFDVVERAVHQVQHQIVQLSSVWLDVLPSELYCSSIGGLADCGVSGFISEVQDLVDMSSTETQQLRSLFEPVLAMLPNIFVKVPTKNEMTTSKYILSWNKFEALVIMLDAGMKDIVKRFKAGKLPGWTSQEIRNFIKSVFSNSDLRASCLKELN
eukprot:m.175499 g.175499  ORF g.175499 m.175499 type:complete len:762 (-) comp31824_c0_seq1:356-2641(-)